MSRNASGKGHAIIEKEYLVIGEQEKGMPFEETERFPLKEVTVEELKELKEFKIPLCIIKKGDRFWVAKIGKNTIIPGDFKGCSHKCANSSSDCAKLSAASDAEGGCAKVRGKAKNIERYPFIDGIETVFNSKPIFVVSGCTRYKKAVREQHLSPGQKAIKKVNLAMHFREDLDTPEKVREYFKGKDHTITRGRK